MLPVLRVPDVEHVRAMQGQDAADAGAGDDMAKAQRAHARQGRGRIVAERHGRRLADLLDRDQRQVAQPLRIDIHCHDLLERPRHRQHHACVDRRLLQRVAVPLRDRRLDRLRRARDIQQFEEAAIEPRIGIGRHEELAVLRGIDLPGDRVVEIGVHAAGIAVEQLPAAVDERAETGAAPCARRHGYPAPSPVRIFQIDATSSDLAASDTADIAPKRTTLGTIGSAP